MAEDAHGAASNLTRLKDIEVQIDNKIKELYDLTEDEMNNVKDSLQLISPSREQEEEEAEDKQDDEEDHETDT